MRYKFENVSRRTKICGIIVVVGFLAFAILMGIYHRLANALDDQQVADRWNKEGDCAQISCYFPQNTGITPDRIQAFQHSLDQYLIQSSIYSDSANPDARLWIAAYSSMGTLSITTERTSHITQAIGVGGDFFLFHPVKLIEGAYFSGQDVMQDYCIVDRETAWKVFGSTDVVGQYLQFNNVPHKIVGVYERPAESIYEKAGLSQPTIFVSYDTLTKYGGTTEVENYEIVMPNPVRSFAFLYITEQLGDKEGRIELLENSSRFDKLRILRLLADTDTRTMRTKAIVYPYWENVARGYENNMMTLLLFAIIIVTVPIVLLGICGIMAWRRKNKKRGVKR